MFSNITTFNRNKGNIKAKITKLSNWKETNDSADIAAHLRVLEKLQKKFDDLKTEYFESATDEEILEIEISVAEMDSDIQQPYFITVKLKIQIQMTLFILVIILKKLKPQQT
ncbi:hypothetical protein NPIL_542271 [Nephila pilipes]|uniref:Uncharacterized protein n=1 Tax=Nephila pilipes TaxID=299642 RepID=A0A8X6T0H3_NEPPI|nr:hypothetical protein NPIL_542271 [Nephila pilipes]